MFVTIIIGVLTLTLSNAKANNYKDVSRQSLGDLSKFLPLNPGTDQPNYLPQVGAGTDLTKYLPQEGTGTNLTKYLPQNLNGSGTDLTKYLPQEVTDLTKYLPQEGAGTVLTKFLPQNLNGTGTDLSKFLPWDGIGIDPSKFLPTDQNGMDVKCDCQEACRCCGVFTLAGFTPRQQGCIVIKYIGELTAINVNFKLGRVVIIDRTVSANDPPRICPPISLAKVCIDFYGIQLMRNKIQICLKVTPRLLRKERQTSDLGCMMLKHSQGEDEVTTPTPGIRIPAVKVPGIDIPPVSFPRIFN